MGILLSEVNAPPSGTESSRKPCVVGCSFGRLPATALPEASSGQAVQAGQTPLGRTLQAHLGFDFGLRIFAYK